MEIGGKLVLLTGASRGIGAAVARELASRGAQLVLVARHPQPLRKVAEKVRAMGVACSSHAVDLTDPGAVEAMARSIKEEAGVPDVLINNAGWGKWLYTEQTRADQVVQMMAVPYFAAFFVTRAFLPEMLARKSGHIVNVTSVASYFPWPGATAYAASRWALRGFNEALRVDLDNSGVTVSLFVSATVLTRFFSEDTGNLSRLPAVARLIPRLSPEAAARAMVRGIERRRPVVITPGMTRLIVLFNHLFPGAMRYLVTRKAARREG